MTMFKPSRFLVPVDFSQESELALEWAVMMAQANAESTIHLLHIVHSEILVPGSNEPNTLIYLTTEREVAEKRLREWAKKIPESIRSVCSVKEGRVSEEIGDYCGEWGIDLVIMTTQGRRGLTHIVHGSVTEATVRLVRCPVLVLHLNQVAREVAQAAS
jgi:nucleotide-binding universal stress UspA family protein